MRSLRPLRERLPCLSGRPSNMTKPSDSFLKTARRNFHSSLCENVLSISGGIATNADASQNMGNDYSISPDIIVARELVSDAEFNAKSILVDESSGTEADLREGSGKLPLLHASVSTKWTLRSDRAQNARSEALNLIRNRKGRTPHIVLVTGEPTDCLGNRRYGLRVPFCSL